MKRKDVSMHYSHGWDVTMEIVKRKKLFERTQRAFKNPAIPTFALVGTIIGSKSLTTVFGMGTGVPFRYGHRENVTPPVGKCDACWIGK